MRGQEAAGQYASRKKCNVLFRRRDTGDVQKLREKSSRSSDSSLPALDAARRKGKRRILLHALRDEIR